MQELVGNLFSPQTYHTPEGMNVVFRPDAICITTNGFVKKNGEAVMGRGCAREAAKLMPGLPEILGSHLNNPAVGNRVLAHGPWRKMCIVTFPVKPNHSYCISDKSNVVKHMRDRFKAGDRVPGWACVADIELIKESAIQLAALTHDSSWTHVVLPRPGCGAGELDWKDIKPILDKILDDRFYAITFPRR